MPVQIGAIAHKFTDPTGLLSDCHRRVESFLGILEKAAATIDRRPTKEMARALESSLHYFQQAAPKHTADEEESLFPRLRQISDPEASAAFLKLDQLEDEHRWAAPLHHTVEQLGRRYLSGGALSASEVVEFRDSVADLAAMYKRHIAVEDEWIFPLALRYLTGTEKAAIAKEMAERRDVN